MSDKYIEKTFLYLIFLSIVLHMAIYGGLSLVPQEKPKVKDEPLMVDLKAMPDLPPPPATEEPAAKTPPPPHVTPLPVPELPDRIDNVPPLKKREAAPPAKEVPPTPPKAKSRVTPPRQQATAAPAPLSETLRQSPDGIAKGGSQGGDFFKPRKGDKVELAKLFPSPKKMASLEESYRKKYEGAEQGDTRMIDTEDPLISVYSHRLLVAANDSLRILGRRTLTREAGVGVLQVTIKRDGTVENVKMVESTKSAALDDLAMSAVRQSGYVGPLPKKWPHERLNLLWIFVSQQIPQY